MTKFNTIDSVLDVLTILAENPYSMIWETVDDIEFNGHIISAKRSNQLNHVIIDHVYKAIGGPGEYVVNNKSYKPLEYVKMILLKKVETA